MPKIIQKCVNAYKLSELLKTNRNTIIYFFIKHTLLQLFKHTRALLLECVSSGNVLLKHLRKKNRSGVIDNTPPQPRLLAR